MHDALIDSLARQLVRYSTSLKKGEKVLIDLHDVPDSIGLALIREVRSKGALPFLRLHQGRLTREMLKGAEDAQYAVLARHLLTEMKDMDAYIAIRGGNNIAETSDVPAERMKLAMKHMRPVLDHRVKKTKWCVLRWPSPSMAQQAGMSTEAFEDFYFKVCLLDYKALQPAMEALKKLMNKTDKVHITGPGTDLRFFDPSAFRRLFHAATTTCRMGRSSPRQSGFRRRRDHLQRPDDLSGNPVRQHPVGVFQRKNHQGRSGRQNQTNQQDPR